MTDKPPIIALMGPTASGKTSLAIELAQRLPVELISVDSALVYRGLDIGSGKPTLAEQALAPHRLIDICEPTEAYSAARFAEDARLHIDGIHREGKVPLLVGGTFLYFRALLDGMANMPPANAALRDRIAGEALENGGQAMHNRLAEIDPLTAARLHPNDAQRIQRALEVFDLTGQSLSQWHTQQSQGQNNLAYEVHRLIYAPDDRAMLHRNIELRFDQMLADGFVAEVEQLVRRGDLDESLPSVRSVGYRQLWQHVAGHCDLVEARDRGIIATRQLAKRQLTWLRNQLPNEPRFNAGDSSGTRQALEYVAALV